MIRCTIAIPVYNSAMFLVAAVRSALSASGPQDLVIAVDDASKDHSWQIMNELVQTLPEDHKSRLKIYRNDVNSGLFGNFNRCLELAEGEYVKILCADDVLLPHSVDLEIEVFERNPSVVLTNSKGLFVSPTGKTLSSIGDEISPGVYEGRSAIAKLLQFHARTGWNPFNYPAGVMIRRHALKSTGSFDTSLRKSGDIDLFYRLLAVGHFAVLPVLTCKVTRHNLQAGRTGVESNAELKELLFVLNRNKEHFHAEKEWREVHREFGALFLFYGTKFLFNLRPKSFLIYIRDIQCQQQSIPIVAFCLFVTRKLFEKLFRMKPRVRDLTQR